MPSDTRRRNALATLLIGITTLGLVAQAPAAESNPAAEGNEQREAVLLGSDHLVAGIPGTGPLEREDLIAWLDDSRNHAQLEPKLPVGLAAGALEVTGLDDNPLTRAKIELGRQLYFDPRLSIDGTVSCATCHDPAHAFADETAVSVGVRGQAGGRNSPVAFNRIFSAAQFWDGRAASLEDQAVGPIANPVEMNHSHDACAECLAQIEGYRLQFERLFEQGVTIDNIARAIACFERVLVTGPAPWDHYSRLASFKESYADDLEYLDELQEEAPELYAEYQALRTASEENPISRSAVRGGELFFSTATNCSVCHNGVNFTDELYYNLGVGMDADDPDWGRYEATGADADRGAFKTPTLRNVAQTAPYMHDGSQQTLEEVVAWYNQGGHPNQWLDETIEPLGLTNQQQADLVEFMKALTGRLPKVETGRLPK